MKLIIHFILVLLAAQSRSETVQSEDARVKWTYSTSSRQDSHPSLPDKVALTLTIASETTTLNLIKKQNSDFGEIPVLLGNNQNVITWNPSKNKKHIGLYNDISKEASFIITVKTENGVTIKGYRGSFDYNCIKYTLAPAKYHEKSKMTTGVTHTISLDGIQYDFYEESEQQTDTEDITDIANDFVERYPWVEAYAAGKERYFVQDRSLRRKRSSKKNLIMDLVVIIDNSMYTRWLKWSGNDMNTCIEQIQHYLAYIFEEVNNIYTSLPSYQITFKVVQIFIAQAPSQSDYLENSVAKQYEDKKKRNFKAALPDFTEWVNKHKLGKGERNKEKFLKQHDHAIAFTDYSEDPIPGAANLGGICSHLSQSIVRAADQHIAISTTAHEIGHALGSTHDGQGNTCDRQYLMSIGRPGIKPLNIFSSCSIDQIEYKIEALENAGQNCMDPSTKQRKRLDLDEFLSSPPGVLMGADRQCASIHGDGYKFCSEGLSTGSTMCNKLMCLDIKTKICQESKTRPGALDGTTCGKGKWCMKGQCVTGAEVKPEDRNKKEYCYFGDHSGAFNLNNERTECKDFIKNPSLCYTSEAFCCDTCETIKLRLSSNLL